MNTLQSMSTGASPWVIFSQFLLLGEQLEAVVDVNGLSALLHCFPHALVINTLLTMETCTGEVGKTHMGSNEHLLKYRIVSNFQRSQFLHFLQLSLQLQKLYPTKICLYI